jgi:hypothetical protein
MPRTRRAGSSKGPLHRPHPILIGIALLAGVAAAGCLPGGSRGGGSGSSGASGQTGVTATPGPTGPTPRPTIVPPTPTPAPTFLVHVAAKGESLNTIAHRYGTSARSVAFWNRSTYPSLDPEAPGYRPDLLQVGWTLFLIPNVILTDDEAPPLPGAGASAEPAASDETGT